MKWHSIWANLAPAKDKTKISQNSILVQALVSLTNKNQYLETLTLVSISIKTSQQALVWALKIWWAKIILVKVRSNQPQIILFSSIHQTTELKMAHQIRIQNSISIKTNKQVLVWATKTLCSHSNNSSNQPASKLLLLSQI